MKELFDLEYDYSQDNGGKIKTVKSIFDSVKEDLQEQARLNKMEFDELDEDARLQYQGFRSENCYL